MHAANEEHLTLLELKKKICLCYLENTSVHLAC